MTVQVLAQHVASAVHFLVWCGTRQIVRCVPVRPVVKIFHDGKTGQQQKYQQVFHNLASYAGENTEALRIVRTPCTRLRASHAVLNATIE
jgi:hypothetical protein